MSNRSQQATERHYNRSDRFCFILDNLLRTVFGQPAITTEENPAANLTEPQLTAAEQLKSARLMRVNYCGEVCAQALYQGQAITARSSATREKLQQAAIEENNHLLWCDERLQELESHRSYLNLLFYLTSLSIGITAGIIGDKWSLGFIEETERQVAQHLTSHLDRLPSADSKSRRIVEKMRDDEQRHGTMAKDAGAEPLPAPIKTLMRLLAGIMTQTTYWL